MTASACPRCKGTISNIQVRNPLHPPPHHHVSTSHFPTIPPLPPQCAKFLDRCFCTKCRFRFCYRKDAAQQCLDLHVCDGGMGSPHGRTNVESIMAAADKDRHRNAQRELRRRQRRHQSAAIGNLVAEADAVSQLVAGSAGGFAMLQPRMYSEQVC